MDKARVLTVNVGKREPNPYNRAPVTGIHKRPIEEAVYVSAPGDGQSGIAGDFIGDPKHHGGEDQAVYAYQREDLDRWENVKGHEFSNGFFGENLTTIGIDINAALIGERWQVGDEVVLEVTTPRIPCATFSGIMSDPKWIKEFTAYARPGTYFRVITPGTIRSGDEIRVLSRPDHDVDMVTIFKARTTDQSSVAKLNVAAEYLTPTLREFVARNVGN